MTAAQSNIYIKQHYGYFQHNLRVEFYNINLYNFDFATVTKIKIFAIWQYLIPPNINVILNKTNWTQSQVI